MANEINYIFKDCYELQLIDANCNNCKFMERDMNKYQKWHDWHRDMALREFYNSKGKDILDAWEVIEKGETENNRKSGEGMARIAHKRKFQFEKIGLLNYGNCTKFSKSVSFLAMTCQIETQHCFEHRRNG